MKKIVSLLLMFTLVGLVNAQDEKSKNILSKLSEKAKGFKTVKATFTKTYKKGEHNFTAKGKLYTKGKKFYLETGEGQNIYCDSRTVWTHIVDDQEVIKCPFKDAFEDEDLTEPNKLFTIWEDDFKSRYVEETTIGGRKYHVINLHPIKPEEKKFHTIELKIDVEKEQVTYITIKGKDGSVTKYHITSFKTNEEISDGKFVWRNKPGVEVYDC